MSDEIDKINNIDKTGKVDKKNKNDSVHDESFKSESQQSAASLSQVSEHKNLFASNATFYILIGAVLLIVLGTFLYPGHSIKKEVLPSAASVNDTNAELSANLAKLKLMNAEMQKPSNLVGAPFDDPTRSKEYLARQNASMNMYSLETSTTTQPGASGVQEATFAEGGSNSAFGNQSTHTSSVSATQIQHADFTIASGEFLHAVLETAMNSDLPGMVRAVIKDPVYAYVGEKPLIPAGSRLIGQYSSGILQGQNRMMVVWNRIVLPNGIAIEVNSPDTDALGVAGQGANNVNTHFFARFGEAALLSLIGTGAATSGVSSQDQNNSEAQYRSAMAQSFQQSAQNSLQNTLPIQPTLHVYQGADINVFVAHDLSFYNVLASLHG